MYNLALEILKKIYECGYESYIIGGYPRNLYLGIDNLDIDICTNAKYEDIKKIFKEYELINQNFGSMILKYKEYEFEITTYRKEYEYEKNRFPKKIEFINSLEEDLKRRDFIINTLCIDFNGEYVDLLNAKQDLDDKIIKCVGNSDDKIKEDILRSLRAIRFATVLNFKLDDNLKESIKKYSYLVTNLSNKRIQEELSKILNSSNKGYGQDLIKELGLDKYVKFDV